MDLELLSRHIELRAFNDEARTADFVASTDVVDSYGDIIDQQSWQLEHYRANPVVLFAHNSRELPIGKAISVGVTGNRLEARIQFASAEMNPKAEQVWQMLKGGYLRAVSVGFLPKNGRYEIRNGQDVWVWSDSVLKEISVTPVPANPEALAKMKSLFSERGTQAMGKDTQIQALERGAKNSPAASPPGSTTEGDDCGRKGEAMDLKELELKVEKQVATIAEKALEVKVALERAEKAEKALGEAEASLKTLGAEKSAFEAQNKSLLERAEKAEAKAAELEAKTIDQEVEALVGAKITAAEKGVYVELRKFNPALFAKMIAERAPLGLTQEVTPAAKTGAGGTADLLEELNGGAK